MLSISNSNPFNYNNTVVVVNNNAREYALMNVYKELIIPFGFYTTISRFTSNYVTTVHRRDYGWGLIDITGREIVPPMYRRIVMRGRYASVQCRETGLWGMIDNTGKIIIPPTYSQLEISGTQVRVQCAYTEMWGILDTTGRVIVSPQFCHINFFVGNYALANIGGFEVFDFYYIPLRSMPARRIRQIGGTWHVINQDGDIIASFEYASMHQVSETLFLFAERSYLKFLGYSSYGVGEYAYYRPGWHSLVDYAGIIALND